MKKSLVALAAMAAAAGLLASAHAAPARTIVTNPAATAAPPQPQLTSTLLPTGVTIAKPARAGEAKTNSYIGAKVNNKLIPDGDGVTSVSAKPARDGSPQQGDNGTMSAS